MSETTTAVANAAHTQARSDGAERRSSAEKTEQPSQHLFAASEFDALFAEERRFVTHGSESEDLKGLAISGGGIRSASFGMGVMQALVAGGKLEDFHYLSTVSGGGYLGSSLTWFLHQGLPNPKGGYFPAGTTAEDFPFGARRPGSPEAESQNAILNYVRQHASYLNPTPQLNFFSLLAVVLRAAFVSLFVYFTLLTGAMGALLWLGVFDPVSPSTLGPLAGLSRYLSSPLLLASAFITAFLAWMSLVYSISTRIARLTRGYVVRTRIQAAIGRISALVIGLGVIGALPLVYVALDVLVGSYFDKQGALPSLLLGAGSTLLGTLLGASEGHRQSQGAPRKGFLDAIRPGAAVGLLLYGLLLSSLASADHLLNEMGRPELLIALGAAGLFFGWVSNINYLGVHRMYRDRLMELFTPAPEAVLSRAWKPALAADMTGIETLCGAPAKRCKRPYHLINTNVVLVDSRSADFRGRGGDSFVLSPLFCGSRATGWIRSTEYMNARAGRGMTLPSAMAISGAAVNPHTGVAGRGLTRNRLVSMLLTLLNLRLGYWAPNPRTARSATPNFLVPGLGAGLLARGLTEDARLVELTDGGHFENLGIYELVRRKAKLIVVCDGGADGGFEFSDLANAVERVRVDFGAKIEFKGEFPLSDILAGSGPAQPESLDAKYRLARRGFAEGTIRYAMDPAGTPSGRIVYFKGTIIPKLPADVLGYKTTHPEFPHESTGDQFFDEVQFEAYRELGYHIGWQWLESLAERKERAADSTVQERTVA